MPPTRIRRKPEILLVGKHRYSLTFSTFQRRGIFMDRHLVGTVLGQILRAGQACQFAIIAYCFMPDHLHLVVRGTTDDADLPAFVKRAKQLSGFHGQPIAGHQIWQSGYFERTLRLTEWTESVVDYILNNPVRAGLVEHPSEYPFSGTNPVSAPDAPPPSPPPP